MRAFKCLLIVHLSFAVVMPASADNSTPRTYIGNNTDLGTKSGRATAKKNARNFIEKEARSKHKKPRWKQEQLARNKKQSSASQGVNE